MQLASPFLEDSNKEMVLLLPLHNGTKTPNKVIHNSSERLCGNEKTSFEDNFDSIKEKTSYQRMRDITVEVNTFVNNVEKLNGNKQTSQEMSW